MIARLNTPGVEHTGSAINRQGRGCGDVARGGAHGKPCAHRGGGEIAPANVLYGGIEGNQVTVGVVYSIHPTAYLPDYLGVKVVATSIVPEKNGYHVLPGSNVGGYVKYVVPVAWGMSIRGAI